MTTKRKQPRKDGLDLDPDDAIYSQIRLRQLFGGVSHMWVRRRLAVDPDFPRPRYVGSIPFWRLGDVRAWWAKLPTTPPLAAIEAGERVRKKKTGDGRRRHEPGLV